MAISQVITAAPDAPTRNDPTNFPTRADAFVSWQENNPTEINTWATQANSTQASINASEVVVANGVAQTLAYRDAAISAANGKGSWSTLTGVIAIPATVYHNSRNWQLLQNLADVTSVEPGTNGAVWFDLTFELVKDVTPQLGGDLDLNGKEVFGDLNLTGNSNITGQQTVKETKDTVYPITDGAAFQIDPGNGNVQTITLGASRTPLATNFESGQLVILGINDGAGYSITWTGVGVTWIKSGGNAITPTLATTGYTWVSLFKVGSTIFGSECGQP